MSQAYHKNDKKVYDKKIVSPYQRLKASSDLSAEAKTDLDKRFAMYDPVKLQGEVHKAVDNLVSHNMAINLEWEKSSPLPPFKPSDYG